jgi:hypothetical protein
MVWINDQPIGTQLRINVPALKSWKRADGNVSFIKNELIKLDTAKQYLEAVANVRTPDQISREFQNKEHSQNFHYRSNLVGSEVGENQEIL